MVRHMSYGTTTEREVLLGDKRGAGHVNPFASASYEARSKQQRNGVQRMAMVLAACVMCSFVFGRLTAPAQAKQEEGNLYEVMLPPCASREAAEPAHLLVSFNAQKVSMYTVRNDEVTYVSKHLSGPVTFTLHNSIVTLGTPSSGPLLNGRLLIPEATVHPLTRITIRSVTSPPVLYFLVASPSPCNYNVSLPVYDWSTVPNTFLEHHSTNATLNLSTYRYTFSSASVV
eukprot:TRINITY_DN1974_c0_g2_i1.p1 TRINITY_DN1974_c0_g2~~TRINITY_DN1974_c0_g2_i1.p1  ORF type:complete len:229 (+),score=34.33 TRINITY_DN1974_c0_g2_i1:34-720(+)